MDYSLHLLLIEEGRRRDTVDMAEELKQKTVIVKMENNSILIWTQRQHRFQPQVTACIRLEARD